jgi:Holliday junction resolvase RusA-like endonuclease
LKKPILKLVSPMPVSVNHYIKPRAFVIRGKAQVSMYETADAKKYKKDFSEYVKEEVKKQGWNLAPNKTQHFYVDCDFIFPRTDMDANNYFKIMLDSITDTQLIWLDDNVTCERVNSITYDSNNPRIEINIYPVDYIGIFTDENDLIGFKNTYCEKCSKYDRNCSILNKAIEGRVQEEIIKGEHILNCLKFKAKK